MFFIYMHLLIQRNEKWIKSGIIAECVCVYVCFLHLKAHVYLNLLWIWPIWKLGPVCVNCSLGNLCGNGSLTPRYLWKGISGSNVKPCLIFQGTGKTLLESLLFLPHLTIEWLGMEIWIIISALHDFWDPNLCCHDCTENDLPTLPTFDPLPNFFLLYLSLSHCTMLSFWLLNTTNIITNKSLWPRK